jgi:ATP-dependent RNA helicase DDX41
MIDFLAKDEFLKLRYLLCISGIFMFNQQNILLEGIHIIVNSWKINRYTGKKKFNLDLYKYLCLNKANRMIDIDFKDDIRNIIFYFTS